MNNIVSTKDAAKLLEVSRQWVRTLINTGRINAILIGTSYAVDIHSIRQYRREVQKKTSLYQPSSPERITKHNAQSHIDSNCHNNP